MVTRLVIAKLMQVGMKAGQKAFRNKKSARAQSDDQSHSLRKPSNETLTETGDVTEASKHNITDKNIG